MAVEIDDSSVAAALFSAGQQNAVPSQVVISVLHKAMERSEPVTDVLATIETITEQERRSIRHYIEQASVERSKLAEESRLPDTPRGIGEGDTADNPRRTGGRNRNDKQDLLNRYQSHLPSGAQRFDPQDELGRGGWGVVLKATDRQLDRDVAVKKLGSHATANPQLLRRFMHEGLMT